jgi:ABC-type transport system involved in multi-copper enzyme maturation permease subunit
MLVRQMIREHLFLVVGYFMLLSVNFFGAIWFWPGLRENLEDMAIIGKLVPIQMVQDMVFMVQEHGYWAYFGLQQLYKGAGIAGMVAAAILGSLLIAREVDSRTAEFLFSRPVSRVKLLLVRWATGLLMVLVPFWLTTAMGVALSPMVEETVNVGHAFWASAYLSIFLAMVFTVTLTMSTFADHQLKPALIMIGFMFVNLAVYMIQTLNSYSIYKFVDLDRIIPIAVEIYPIQPAIWFSVVTVVALGVGMHRISKRDF